MEAYLIGVLPILSSGIKFWNRQSNLIRGTVDCLVRLDLLSRSDRWTKTLTVESVQDFLIKLDMKPCMHLVETSIFSLNPVIVRPTKIMNRADKNWAQF